jgi:transcriptional regulator with XRE-family HTH domain
MQSKAQRRKGHNRLGRLAGAAGETKVNTRPFALTLRPHGGVVIGMHEPTLDGVLRGLFGRSWRRIAPRVMRYSERYLMRIRTGRGRPSLRSLQRLERWARKSPPTLEASRRAEHARIDAEYEGRRLENAGGMTALRQLIRQQEQFEERRECAGPQARLLQRKAERQRGRVPPPA